MIISGNDADTRRQIRMALLLNRPLAAGKGATAPQLRARSHILPVCRASREEEGSASVGGVGGEQGSNREAEARLELLEGQVTQLDGDF